MNNVEMGSMAGSATSITAGATAAITLNEWAIFVGIATALLTLALNLWCSKRRDAREQDQAEQQRKLADRQTRLAELEELEAIARLKALGLKP